jgi:hypothetical protein
MIKCNQQINFHGKTKKENRFIKKSQHIYRKAGITGFFKGFWATFNRDGVSTGLYFLIYYSIKDYRKKNKLKFDSLEKCLAGGLAGLVTWFVTFPFDTIKSIIQTGPFKEKPPRQFTLIKDLYKQGGVFELYRGASPALSLSVLSAALNFLFFETFKGVILPKKDVNK